MVIVRAAPALAHHKAPPPCTSSVPARLRLLFARKLIEPLGSTTIRPLPLTAIGRNIWAQPPPPPWAVTRTKPELSTRPVPPRYVCTSRLFISNVPELASTPFTVNVRLLITEIADPVETVRRSLKVASLMDALNPPPR